MTELGNYLIGKTIGEGTFGKVCHAKHQVLGHDVAVKILEKKRINDELDIERVKREITILQMLHHPNVVQLYEMIETDTHIYLFMEYADGGELFDYIDLKKRINEVEACKFLHEIISAIQYIHQMRIVHRDLKPENLLLTTQKNILVVDFGLSNMYEDTLKTACGSPCYAAPEMIQGKPYYGLQTDIWSCGVILYAMLCGYLPFEDSNTQVLYKKILNADFHIPRYVSLDGKDLIKNILTVDPTKRFTIEQIKQHKWWQLWKSENVQMTPFKASFNKIQCTLLPNSIYKSCVKKNIERNISEDVKTCCDTAQQSIDIQFTDKDDFNYKSIIKEESIIQDPIILNPIPEQFNQCLDQQLLNAQDQFEFQQSMRSLTRQKSSQSIQSIKHLQTQIDSPLKTQNITIPTKQPITTKQQITQINKIIPKKPPIIQQQPQQQQLSQKKPNSKIGPSKSLHEPPNFENKLTKLPNTPSNKQQTNNSTNSSNNTTFTNHQLKTDIPKKNSIPPVKLTVIQEQLKENKEKSHSLKTQPTQSKQQQVQQQNQQQQFQQQKQQINLSKPQNLNKTPIKQNTAQINSAKRSLHQKQTASLQIERQSFHTQQSTVEENITFQFNDNPKPSIENTKLMVEKFTSRLNNVSIPSLLKQNQKQGIQDIKGIENYYGPYNLSFITKKHPQLFLKGIQKYLEEKYQFIQIQNYQNGFNFSLNEQKIDLKLYRIENLEIFYCQITCPNSKNNSNHSEFNAIIYDLQSNFEF